MEVGHAVRTRRRGAGAGARRSDRVHRAPRRPLPRRRQARIWEKFRKEVPRLLRSRRQRRHQAAGRREGRAPRALRRHRVPARAQREERAGRLPRPPGRAVGGQGALPRARLRRPRHRSGRRPQRQAQALVDARRFFLTVRTAAHLAPSASRTASRSRSRRRSRRGLLPQSARRRSTAASSRAVAPAVEALMQQYFLHAKAVTRETDRLLERCVVEAQQKPPVRPVRRVVRAVQRQAVAAGRRGLPPPPVGDGAHLQRRARDRRRDLRAHQATSSPSAVRRHAARSPRDPLAGARASCASSCDDRDTRNPSLLEQAHDLGLLAAVMPEFAPCTGRVQHDLYHVFTVDQHQLYAVGAAQGARARRARRGAAAADRRRCRRCGGRRALYLGTLLHDVGKPLGKGHSEKGARLARRHRARGSA